MPARKFVTIAAAALLIGKSPDTVWRHIRNTEATGEVVTDRYAGQLVVDINSLTEYVATRPGRGRPRTTTRTENTTP